MDFNHLYLYILFMPGAYLLGSIPTGILVSRVFGGADPRTTGSRNIGATNVGRSAGKAAGIMTLAGDILKGALPTYAALKVNPEAPFVALTGFSAFAGHLFPVFLKFRGGKGVATACGVMAVISPIATLLGAAVFLLAALVKRYVSLASMLAAAMMPVFLSFLPRARPFVPLGVAVGALIIIKHRENIKRLVSGTENRIGGKKG